MTVASLLLKAARRRGKRLEIVEWPGGKPQSIDLKVSDPVMKAVIRGATYVPVAPVTTRVPELAGLSWGSRVRLYSGTDRRVIVSGPAYVRKGRWALEVIEEFGGKAAKTRADRRAQQLLKVGYGPRYSTSTR